MSRPRYSKVVNPITELQNVPSQQYARNEETISADTLKKVCKENPDALKAPKNKSCFWYDVAIRDVSEKLNPDNAEKYPEYVEFWHKHIKKVKELFIQQDSETIASDKFAGENAAQIITDANGLYSLKSLVNFIDGGSAKVADGDNDPNGPWGVASRIFAQNAEGIVSVISGNRKPIDTSIWATTELPALMNNSKVDMIVERDGINPDIVKSVRFVNGLNLHNLQECLLPIPVELSKELKKSFSAKSLVTIKEIYQKTKLQYINIPPCIIEYSENGNIEYSFLDKTGKKKEKSDFKKLQTKQQRCILETVDSLSNGKTTDKGKNFGRE